MKELHLTRTTRTPEVYCNPQGIIRIIGRGLDVKAEPEQLTRWINEYVDNPAEVTNVYIAFEYINTVRVKKLFELLKSLIMIKGKVTIHWYYEFDDVDMQERGEYLSLSLNYPIQYIQVHNISGL
ncbi:MAG TPA: SiaC family regulatory phosphoprotein [Bacteroidales bacterium]|nr:SiaC family regulatory phosphoprotein [Bacteroidales bacterium]